MQHLARLDFHAHFLGAQQPFRAIGLAQRIAVGGTIPAAMDARTAMARAIAGGISVRGAVALHHQLQRGTMPAAKLALARRAGAKFVSAEMQREARLGHFHAAEFQPAGRMPLTGRGPAIALCMPATARPRVEQVPDEFALPVFRLWPACVPPGDGDAEAPAPAAHRPLRAAMLHGADDRLHDLIAAMAGAERHRRALPRPDHAALPCHHAECAEGAVILLHIGIQQIGEGHAHGRKHVGVGGIHEARHLVIAGAQIHGENTALLGAGGADGDVLIPVPVIIQQRRAAPGAIGPGLQDARGVCVREIEDGLHRLHQAGAMVRQKITQPVGTQLRRPQHGRQIAPEIPVDAGIERQHGNQILSHHAILAEQYGRDA